MNIEVPEAKCSKCDTKAPVVVKSFQPWNAFTARQEGFQATGSDGSKWHVSADKPKGWVVSPIAANAWICSECNARVQEAAESILRDKTVPAEPEKKAENCIPIRASVDRVGAIPQAASTPTPVISDVTPDRAPAAVNPAPTRPQNIMYSAPLSAPSLEPSRVSPMTQSTARVTVVSAAQMPITAAPQAPTSIPQMAPPPVAAAFAPPAPAPAQITHNAAREAPPASTPIPVGGHGSKTVAVRNNKPWKK